MIVQYGATVLYNTLLNRPLYDTVYIYIIVLNNSPIKPTVIQYSTSLSCTIPLQNRPLHNTAQVMNVLYNSPTKIIVMQQDAAMSGAIPLSNRPLYKMVDY